MYRVGISQILSVAVGWFVLLNTAPADLIYTLENYPSFQDGHQLSGIITTTSTAPDDGFLQSAEIVDWSFTVTGPNGFSAAMTGNSPPEVTGEVAISPQAITIAFPSSDPAINEFQLAEDLSFAPFLRYLMVNDDLGAGIFEQYDAGPSTGDESWQTFPGPAGLGGAPWVIATAIPEPSPFMLVSLVLLATGLSTRWLRRTP